MTTGNHELVELEGDDIDDILYSVRTNDKDELDASVKAHAEKHSTTESIILQSSIAQESGNTSLHYAAANGLTGLLSHILLILDLPAGSDFVNRRNASGNTSLHWSSLNGHLETTKALVDAGADLWLRNSAGNLAVFEAERAGKDDIVAYLLKVGGTEKESGDGSGDITMTAGDMSGEGDEVDVDVDVSASGDMQVDDSVSGAAEEMATTTLDD